MKQPSSPRSPILNNMNYVNDEIRDILPTPTQINIGTAQVIDLLNSQRPGTEGTFCSD